MAESEQTKHLQDLTKGIAKTNESLAEVKAEVSKSNDLAGEELDYVKKRNERNKRRGEEQKEAEGQMIAKLEGMKILNEDFQDEILADMKKGVEYDADQLKQMYASFNDIQAKDKRDAKEKRLKERKEEERLASNLRSEESLKGMLEMMGLSQETAARAAKTAMQLKESVHVWWEDKKEKIAAGAKSILEWLTKAAGLGALWALFTLLAKTDWAKLYEDTKLWTDLIWTGLTRFFAFKGIKDLIGWMKKTKVAGLIKAAFQSVVNVIKLVLGTGLEKLSKFFHTITKGVFTKNGAIGKKVIGMMNFFKDVKGGLAEKIANMWKKSTDTLKAGLKLVKTWAKPLTNFFSNVKGGLVEKLGNMWKSITTGASTVITNAKNLLKPTVDAFKNAVKPLTDFFKTGKSATGVGGIFTKISGLFGEGSKIMQGVAKAKGFLMKAGKIFAKLFAPITVFMAAWAAISGGLDEAEKESGSFPQKILAFVSGALKGLIDFFVFDLANLIQDGIKWAIGWFMGLFGFNEEEIEKATDFDFVKPIKDAVFGAIDWVRNLFKFDGKGISFKGLAPLIDILMFPLNTAMNWLNGIFKFSTDETGEAKKFSIGGLITGALDKIAEFFSNLLNFKISDLIPKDSFLGKLGSKIGLFGDDDDAAAEAKKNSKQFGGATDPLGLHRVNEAGMEMFMPLTPGKIIPAKESAEIMGSNSGGGNISAPTVINNQSPTTMIAPSNSMNPVNDKYFRN